MRAQTPSHMPASTVVRWVAISLAVLVGLSEWLALLRARRRQQMAQQMTGLRQG